MFSSDLLIIFEFLLLKFCCSKLASYFCNLNFEPLDTFLELDRSFVRQMTVVCIPYMSGLLLSDVISLLGFVRSCGVEFPNGVLDVQCRTNLFWLCIPFTQKLRATTVFLLWQVACDATFFEDWMPRICEKLIRV